MSKKKINACKKKTRKNKCRSCMWKKRINVLKKMHIKKININVQMCKKKPHSVKIKTCSVKTVLKKSVTFQYVSFCPFFLSFSTKLLVNVIFFLLFLIWAFTWHDTPPQPLPLFRSWLIHKNSHLKTIMQKESALRSGVWDCTVKPTRSLCEIHHFLRAVTPEPPLTERVRIGTWEGRK